MLFLTCISRALCTLGRLCLDGILKNYKLKYALLIVFFTTYSILDMVLLLLFALSISNRKFLFFLKWGIILAGIINGTISLVITQMEWRDSDGTFLYLLERSILLAKVLLSYAFLVGTLTCCTVETYERLKWKYFTEQLGVSKEYPYEPQSGVLDVTKLKKYDYAFKIGENCFMAYRLFLDTFRACKTRDELVQRLTFNILVLSRMFSQDSAVVSALGGANVIYDALLDKFNEIFNDGDDFEPQSGVEDMLGEARTYLDSYKAFKHCQLYEKTYRFFLYAMSFSLFAKAGVTFDSLGYRKVEAEAIRKKYHSRTDFLEVCADTLLFLCERGYQIMKTGSFQPLFHSGSSYEKWYDDYTSISKEAKYMHSPLAYEEVFGKKFIESSFLVKLKETIEKGESIVKYCSSFGSFERKSLRKMVDQLHLIQCDLLTTSIACENRDVPFSLLIYGDSKIGKSSIKDMLRLHFAKKQGLPQDDSMCFTVSPGSKHWTNFGPHQHTLIMDDVAFMRPDAAPNGDPSVMELLQIINGVPYMPEQAAIEKKGTTPLRAKLVIATTNTKNLNAHAYFSCPSAVQRRFPYIITPRVKAEYQCSKGFLDSTKVNHEASEYPDWWTWTVEKVDPVKVVDSEGKRKQIHAERTKILDKVSLADFLVFLNDAIENHDRVAEAMSQSVATMRQVELCEMCSLPTNLCGCIQAGDEAFGLINPRAVGDFLGVTVSLLSIILPYLVFLGPWFVGFGFIISNLLGYFNRFKHWLVYKITTRIFMWYGKRVCRRWIRRLGDRAYYSMRAPAILGIFAGVLASGLLISKLRSSVVYEVQDASEGNTPRPDKQKRENVWYADKYEVNALDLSPTITSYKSLPAEQLISLLCRNVICFLIGSEKPRKITRGICLEGQFYMINKHALDDFPEGFYLEVVSQKTRSGVSMNLNFFVSKDQVHLYPERDLALLYLPNMPPKRSIVELYPKSTFFTTGNCTFLGRRTNGMIDRRLLTKCVRRNNARLTSLGITSDVIECHPSENTVNGDCGSLYVEFTRLGPVITGFHVMGSSGVCIGLFVDQSWIKEKLSAFNLPLIQSGYVEVSSATIQREVGKLSPKSVFRYIEDGTAQVAGSFSGFKPSMKTAVCKTPMFNYLTDRGFVDKYAAPQMTGWAPWRHAALELVNPIRDFDYSKLRLCKESFLMDILDSDLDLSILEPYDDFTTINGCAAVAFVDKMPRNTSTGNPDKCSKKKFLRPIPAVGDNMHPVEVSEEIWNRVRRITDCYLKGERAHPEFCAHLKDEAVTKEKAQMGKTRVFTGAPFAFSIVVRKFLLSACRLIQNNQFAFEAAPGIIVQSRQWTRFYEYITQFGVDRIVAGDYSKYDKKMSPVVILLAFEILIDLCRASGNYTADDEKILWGIAYDTAFPVVDFNGDLVQFYGSNPSGHPLTVIINSLVNSLYIRYSYLELNPDREVRSFKSRVALMTYGDDNIMNISTSISWFHHTSISNMLGSIGIGYTMPDKETLSVPFINISEATFLKRRWVYNEELEAYLAPLEYESIEKRLLTWTKSKTVWSGEQAIDIVKDSVTDFFFYGREEFLRRKVFFQTMVHHIECVDCDPSLGEHTLDVHVNESTFPTWSSLVKRFNSYE